MRNLVTAVVNLVFTNPNLEALCVSRGEITDQSLFQLVTLSHVKSLELGPVAGRITKQGLYALLTGASRASLDCIGVNLLRHKDKRMLDMHVFRSDNLLPDLLDVPGRHAKFCSSHSACLLFTCSGDKLNDSGSNFANNTHSMGEEVCLRSQVMLAVGYRSERVK